MPTKLLAVGGSRKVARRVEKPVLYHFVGSFNSGKATFAAQLSAKRDDFDLRLTLHMRDNYTIEYARLNPDTMAVPTMEIDDMVFTDSYDMVVYLMDNYPGAGDKAAIDAGRRAQMLEFVHFAKDWDEYMYTYGHMGEQTSEMANGIRLAHLRQNIAKVLDEKPEDKDFLVDAYVKKIANVQTMKRAQVNGEQKTADLQANISQLHSVLARGSELLEQNGGRFLFGDDLTTADVFFLPIFRMFGMASPAFFDVVWERHSALKAYWERALAHPDVDTGLMKYVSKGTMICAMFGVGVPRLILSWKLGLIATPRLPDAIERRIDEATEQIWASMEGRMNVS